MLEHPSDLAAPSRPTAPPWRDYCDSLRGVVFGNAVDLLVDGREAFPAMLAAIESATTSVSLETYILADDAIGRRFAAALVAASARGVSCALLYDAFGSRGLQGAFVARLREAGVCVVVFRPLSARVALGRLRQRHHRKVLIVDGRVAFVGGMNVHVPAAPREEGGEGWRDVGVRVVGPAVGRLVALFLGSWRLARGRPTNLAVTVPPPDTRGAVAVRIIAAGRLRGRFAIRRAFLHAVAVARDSVLVASGYFIPDPGLVRELGRAVARGVRVAVLVPERSDVLVADWARGAVYERLLDAGVHMHHWRESGLHSKVAVVDDVWSMVGSYNFDRLSWLRNREIVVNALDAGVASRLGAMLRADIAAAHEVTADGWRGRSLWRRLLHRLAYALVRWM